MANIKIKMFNGSDLEDLYPSTIASNVMTNKEKTVEQELEAIKKNYYDSNITIKPHKHSNGTIYYLTKIPYNTSNKIKKSFANDVPHINDELPRTHAIRKNAIFAINASGYYTNKTLMGVQIKDGVAYGEQASGSKWYTLGIKKDGTLKAYSPDKNSSYLLDDGVENSFCFTIPLIENNTKVSEDILSLQADRKEQANRQVIAQYSNKDYLILTSEGRTNSNKGLTLDEVIEILLAEGVVFAYNLDGGGSTQTIYNGSLINVPYDKELGAIERATGDILYFSVDDTDINSSWYEDLSKVSEKITLDVLRRGIEDTKKNKFDNAVTLSGNYPTLILDETSNGNGGICYRKNGTNVKKINLKDNSLSCYDYNLGKDILNVSNEGLLKTIKGTFGDFFTNCQLLTANIDTLNSNGAYWINPSTPNIGNAGTGVLLHMQLGSTNSNAIQINFRMNASSQKRVCSNGVWGSWGTL